jgi:hypothetical protein
LAAKASAFSAYFTGLCIGIASPQVVNATTDGYGVQFVKLE